MAAAEDFVDGAPGAYRIGLVTFDTTGHTIVTPTTDKAALHRCPRPRRDRHGHRRW